MKKEYWKQLEQIKTLIREENGDNASICDDTGLALVALYAFYHYFNADNTRIEEVLSGIVNKGKGNLHVLGIFPSLFDDESVDFLSVMQEDYFR